MRNMIALAGLIVGASLLGGCAGGGLTGSSMLPSAAHHLNVTGGGPGFGNPDNVTGGGPGFANPSNVTGGGPGFANPSNVTGGGPGFANPGNVVGGGPGFGSGNGGGQSRIRHKH